MSGAAESGDSPRGDPRDGTAASGGEAGARDAEDDLSGGHSHEPLIGSVDAPLCDLCGSPMRESHCKLVCDRCGYMRDCSDP